MAVEAYINPAVLHWARERSKSMLEEAAQRVGVKPEWLAARENDTERPTLRQAQQLAERLNVPFGYLFLSAPPAETLPLPDLRTVSGEPPGQPSPELFDVLNDALAKQEWYRDDRLSEDAPRLPFVGRFSLESDAETIAEDLRQTIGIDRSLRKKASSWEHFLRLLIAQVEAAGVLVLRNGVVGHNTHRALSVQEFRGFVISDDVAPLIFVNARDAKSAQIFTLAHELAHLWIGASGVSNPDYGKKSAQQTNAVERLSNRVAAEVLLPSDELQAFWNAAQPIEVNLNAAGTAFRVSPIVVLRQAYDSALVLFDDFRSAYDQLMKHQQARASAGQGGDFYNSLLARSSRTLTLALTEALAEDRVTYREAARLLNVRLDTLQRITAHLSELSA